MAGYSSDGSSSFFTSEMPKGSEFPYKDSEVNLDREFWEGLLDKNELSGSSVGLTDCQTNQFQWNQVETPECSYQTKSDGDGAKLTSDDQKKEKKRHNDYMYRQRRKKREAEQIAEIEFMKGEMKRLNAENLKLKGLLDQSQQYHPRTWTTSQIGSLETDGLQNSPQMIPISAITTYDFATKNQQNPGAGTCKGSILQIKHLMEELDEDDETNVSFSNFAGLDGERVKVGRYTFPLSLRPVVDRLMAIHGDVSSASKMNRNAVEATYILFCASIKEMGELQLEQVTKGRILKWRDTIRDALRMNFKVEFAMEHLKKITRAYIRLVEHQKMEELAITFAKLEADMKAKYNECVDILVLYEEYYNAKNEFGSKPVGEGMF